MPNQPALTLAILTFWETKRGQTYSIEGVGGSRTIQVWWHISSLMLESKCVFVIVTIVAFILFQNVTEVVGIQ